MKIKVEVETKNGILTFTSEDIDAVKRFLEWATTNERFQKQSTQTSTKTQSTTQKTQTSKTTRKEATPKQIEALKKYIEELKEAFGKETVEEVLKANNIQIDKLTSNQLRRAYAILRSAFPSNIEDLPI